MKLSVARELLIGPEPIVCKSADYDPEPDPNREYFKPEHRAASLLRRVVGPLLGKWDFAPINGKQVASSRLRVDPYKKRPINCLVTVEAPVGVDPSRKFNKIEASWYNPEDPRRELSQAVTYDEILSPDRDESTELRIKGLEETLGQLTLKNPKTHDRPIRRIPT